ncbi:MAG: hypothetical protein QNJ97_19840 [Myxococcota bacterium]|nr:hypothetical protein [Myxococcota bacterium]
MGTDRLTKRIVNRVPALAISIAVLLLLRPGGGLGQDAAPIARPAPKSLARGGPIIIGVVPAVLMTRTGDSARIGVILPPGSTNVALFAAHGSVGRVEMMSTNRATATYHLPKSYLPQVDIIAAAATLNNKRVWGYAAISIYGQGEAELKTQAHAQAKIAIGDRQFGPVAADRFGRATIDVDVPPGVRLGYDSHGSKVSLKVPITPRSAVFAETTAIDIARTQSLPLYGVIVGQDGTLDGQSMLEMVASRGIVKNVMPLGRGAFAANYIAEDKRPGEVQIKALVADDEAPPARLVLHLVDSSSISARPIDANPYTTEDAFISRIFTSTRLGYAWEPPSVGAFHISGDMGILSVIFDQQMIAGIEVGFTASTVNDNVVFEEGINSAKIETRKFPASLVAGWRRPITPKISVLLFSQFGVVFAVNKNSTTTDGRTFISVDRGWRGLIGLGAGIEWKLGVGNVLGGIRYALLPGKFSGFTKGFSTVFFDLGYRLWFL